MASNCEEIVYYILLQDKEGVKQPDRTKKLYKQSEKKPASVVAGEILFQKLVVDDTSSLLLTPVEQPLVIVECYKNEVKKLEKRDARLLMPLSSGRERLDKLKDESWLRYIHSLQKGHQVVVKLAKHSSELCGYVRYIGEIEYKHGTHFGIELKEMDGYYDGTFIGTTYFKCKPNHGVFVKATDIVVKKKSKNEKNDVNMLQKTVFPSKSEHEIGDIVWTYIEEKPHRGIIKYIGRPPAEHRTFAGIHLDHGNGMGDGEYHGTRLFDCPPNHANFTPIEQVITVQQFKEIYENGERSKKHDSRNKGSIEDLIKTESNFAKQEQKDFLKEQEEWFKKAKEDSGKLESGQSSNRSDSFRVDTSSSSSQDAVIEAQKRIFENATGIRKIENSSDIVQQNGITNGITNDTSSQQFNVGDSVVVLSKTAEPKYGIIRWIGFTRNSSKKIAGLELEKESDGASDGHLCGQRYFTCPDKHGFFVHLHNCHPDTRQIRGASSVTKYHRQLTGGDFGNIFSPVIEDYSLVPPPSHHEVYTKAKVAQGIQGHHNSCYLDSTLFAAFAFSSVLDGVLLRERQSNDIEKYTLVRDVLRNNIIFPLRRYGFVRADRVLELRQLLDDLGSVTGLTHEEKDPEEFILTLFQDVLKAEPFVKLKSGTDTHGEFFYQVFADKDVERVLPSVEELLRRSFHETNLKLAQVPSCLIVQMPRFGKKFKMYNRILPSLTINIGQLVENVPQDCCVCGRLAVVFCKQCLILSGFTDNDDATGHFCDDCSQRKHSHKRRLDHETSYLKVSKEIQQYYHNRPVEHHEMELFAVVCIETSHYVAFVKCNDVWCFFDSMADRNGSKDGYNIPSVTECPELNEWLSCEKHNRDRIIDTENKDMPDRVRRILNDAYMCFYQSKEMMLYL